MISYNPNFDRLLEWHSCPKYESYWEKYFKSPDFKNLVHTYDSSLTWVKDQFNVKLDSPQYDYLFYLVDYLLTAEFHGKLKVLTNNKNVLKNLTTFNVELLYKILIQDDWMQSVAMTNFSVTIRKIFENAISKNKPEKAFAFFTHDLSIIQFLRGLEVIKTHMLDDVPFASNIILELRNHNGTYMVYKVFNGKTMGSLTFDEFKVQMGKIKKIEDNEWINQCKL